MTLNHQSKCLAWMAAVTLVFVAMILGWTVTQVRLQSNEILTANATVRNVSSFRFLIMETALYRESRSVQQWNESVASFRKLLKARRYTDPAQNALLDQELANLAVIIKLYTRLTGVDSSPLGKLQGDSDAVQRTATTVSALYLTTQEMADDAIALVHLNQIDLENSHNYAALAMLISILTLAALALAYHQINRRRVLIPITRLQKGTEQVMKGDLNYQIALTIDNELGQLGRNFDLMTRQLGQSYVALKTENAERRSAQASLEDSIAQLAQQGEALVHSQQEMQTIIDQLPALVVYWDTQLHNRFANAAYVDWFGTTPAQMRGQHMCAVIGEARFATIAPFIRSALAGNTEVFEREVISPTGQIRQALFSYVPDIVGGEIKGIYGFISDVTSLRQAQTGQATALAMLQQTIDAASDFSIIATDLTGTIKLFSTGAQRMLGFTAAEVIDQMVPSQLHIASEITARGAALSAQFGWPDNSFNPLTEPAMQGMTDSREWTYVRKDGSTLPVSLSITTVIDANEQVSGFLGIAKDIREERAIRQSLADARDQAEAASLAKSQFLANMSHEIRTPMNAILGMLQLLQYTALSNTQRDYALKTEGAAQSLLILLNDILDFSKLDAGKMQLDSTPFTFNELMRDIGVILSANLGTKNLELLFSLDPALPAVVHGDLQRLRQVLLNLASNAIKFTHQGEVVVRLRVLARNDATTVIEFSVCDTGIGIAANDLDSIFTSFSQAEASTSRRFGGTGLGLTISQHLVALMGGKLTVESQLGVGSRFAFVASFAHADDKPAQVAVDSVQNPATGHQIRALIVDDNASARTVLLAMIHALGWHGVTADSGAEALALLRQRPADAPNFDVMLVDWNMPGMDGWEVSRQIREQYAEVPLLIMVTAHGRSALAERLESERHLVDGFLVKPVTASMLSEAVTLAAAGSANMAPTQIQPSTNKLAGLRLLVVDDNALNLQIARELLLYEGAEVTTENHGASVEARILAAVPQFDALLTDIQMPDIDGFEVTRRVRAHAHLQRLPIIAMTANVMAGDREACLAAGMNDHVGKPINIKFLIQTLLRHCQPARVSDKTVIPPPALAQGSETIAFSLALARLGGNTDLYVNLARQFERHAPEEAVQLRQALEQRDQPTAARIMHTMKSTAGTLGAQELSAFVATCEAQWQQADDLPSVEAVLVPLLALINASLHALRAITTNLQRQPVTSIAPSSAALSLLLDRFEASLLASSLDALDLFATILCGYPAAIGPHAAPIARHLEQMNFQLAHAACLALRVNLDKTIDTDR